MRDQRKTENDRHTDSMAYERRNEGHKRGKRRPGVEGGGEELRVISVWSVREEERTSEKMRGEAAKQRKQKKKPLCGTELKMGYAVCYGR